MPTLKTGPLSRADLMALWKSVTDEGYHRPLLENPESGIEAVEQAADQLARASTMIDRTTQAMFIMAWSGQTDEPASGAVHATVTIRLTRSLDFDRELTFAQGQVMFEQEVADYGPEGPVMVRTGRRYVVAQTRVLVPGQAEIDLPCVAERPGYGYNLPFEGDIRRVVQRGAGLANIEASLVPGNSTHRLVLAENPDVISPEQVGQYVEIIAGANIGQRRRIVGYERPDPATPHGGVAVLSATGTLRVSAVAGTFQLGEELLQVSSGARGTVLVQQGAYLVFERVTGAFVVGGSALTGVVSAASATLDAIEQSPDMVAETGTVGWEVLGWEESLGVSVTNPDVPTGGRSAMLDELGAERRIYRAPNEPDTTYRKKVFTLPDVVSPGAVRRVANRVLAPFGQAVCLREVGDVEALFPGFFFDVVSGDPKYAYAWDLDFALRPQDRFKLVMSYLEMRAFFMVGVPPMTLGEFGFPFDDPHPHNAFDASPYLVFFDGFPVTAAQIAQSIYQKVDQARAGGVGFDLYVEDVGCF